MGTQIKTFCDDKIADVVNSYMRRTITSLEDLYEVSDFTKRRLYLIDDITADIGPVIEAAIRLYNNFDDENNIPVEERLPIKIFINTDGGDLLAAFTIADAILLSTTPVWTINQGKAYSAGFLIFICGHKRLALNNSSFLFHEGAITLGGDAHKFENGADFYKKQRGTIKDLVINQTKVNEETYKEHCKDDWWLTSKDALEYGVADEVVDRSSYLTI